MDQPALRLRPHHIICIQHYAGRGYDDDFNHRMNEICEMLQDGQTKITLVSGADDVCGSCPNFFQGSCLSAEKIDQLDQNWLSAAKLQLGQTLTWDEICLKTKGLFNRPDLFRRYCGSCVWYNFCTRVRTFAVATAKKK